MLQAEPYCAEFQYASPSEPGAGARPTIETLLCENVRLREEMRALEARSINDRRQVNYYKRMHQGATERLEEKNKQIEALKAKVAELQHRLFGRKSERTNPEEIVAPLVMRRPRGQQRGAAGHGRKRREDLPVIDIELDPPAEQLVCARCGRVREPWGEPEVSEQIEWEVRLLRRRTIRKKYRRPKGCTCEDGLPEILCAPPPVSLIPKGLLGISFIVEALLLKFLYCVPLQRILVKARSEGMALSAGTLCGVFERITPLFVPLYEAIYARSRQEDLALMDETRWALFIEEEGKGSYRWWLWVVVTSMTRLYILSPSRSGAVPKGYFGYDAENEAISWHKQVMVDRYKAYEFLKDLLQLAYCWAHVRRDFLEARCEAKERQWADAWVERIGALYQLNKARLALGCEQAGKRELPAPFVQLDARRMKAPQYQQADTLLRHAVREMADARRGELLEKELRTPRRKILQSMENHWHGLTLFVEHPQIPMDNNGAERAARVAAVARKNYYGSGSKWSGQLLVMLLSLLQTLLLHKVDPRKYLSAYLQACAKNGSLAPCDLTDWLPWNFALPTSEPQNAGAQSDLNQPKARAP
jgi:transposase